MLKNTEKSKETIQIRKKPLLLIISLVVALLVLASIGNKWYGQISDYKKQVAYSNLRAHEFEQQVKELKASQNKSSSTKYLDIKELGIKIELSDQVNDAYYTLEQVPSPSGPLVHISTQKAKEIAPNCAADKTSLMTLSSSDPTAYQSQVEYGVSNIKKVGDRYISVEDSIGTCWPKDHNGSPANVANSDQITSITNSLLSADLLPL